MNIKKLCMIESKFSYVFKYALRIMSQRGNVSMELSLCCYGSNFIERSEMKSNRGSLWESKDPTPLTLVLL